MSLQRNYYEVIGVTPTATTDDIKKKYRELARQFHPDVVKDKTLGQKVFTQINQAYRVLADPERRSLYDTTLLTDKVRSGNGASASPASGAAASAHSSQTTASTQAPAQPPSQQMSVQQASTTARLMADAESAMMQNKLGNVKTICDKVLEIDPRNSKAFSLMGDALVQMGKPRDAAAAYRHAQQIAPSALLQSKINRLEGAPAASAATHSATGPGAGIADTSTGAASAQTSPNRTNEGSDHKPAAGLLSRLLGRK